jgi:hypothetical protein
MGTRGYYVFKYNNKYYIFYNQQHSYFDVLGRDIVNDLHKMTIDDFNKMKSLIENITDRINTDGYNLEYNGLFNALKNYYNYYLHISDKEPEADVEYVYIINLDRQIFIVKSIIDNIRYAFNLIDIPNNWLDIVEDI